MQGLGERLEATRKLSLFALDQARARAKASRAPLADVLVETGALSETELLRFMARELDTRFVVSDTLRRLKIPANVAALLPVSVAERYCAVPIQSNPSERSVVLVMADPRQAQALDELPDIARMESVHALVGLPSAIHAVIRSLYYDDPSALVPSRAKDADVFGCPQCAAPARRKQLQCVDCGLILPLDADDSGWECVEPSVVRALIVDNSGRHALRDQLTVPRAAVVSNRALDGGAVPRLVPGLDILQRPLSEFEGYVAAFVDGVLDVSALAREARVSAVEVESVLVSLAERGIVELSSPPSREEDEPRTVPTVPVIPPEALPPRVAPAAQRTRNVLELAMALERSGAVKQAVALLQEEIGRVPNAAPLMNRLAVVLLKQRNYPDAESLLRQAMALQPENEVYRKNLMAVLARAAAQTGSGPSPVSPIVPDRF